MKRKNEIRVLQLGKFYPVGGGVEKVMYDLMEGLSGMGVHCDMLCAACEGESRTLRLNSCAELMCCHTWVKLAATMISPSMILKLRKICGRYDIIHVHHPDPMACLALFCSGYKGKVVLHWHSDILKQKTLLKLYAPLQNWLIKRADLIMGTTPVYISESPFLKDVQHKSVCLPIGVDRMIPAAEAVREIENRYAGKKIVFSLGRLVPYKGYRYLVGAARYLDDSYVVLIGGTGELKEELQAEIDGLGLQQRVKLLGHISDSDLPAYYGACKVFCLSSVQKTEAFAIVQIEAMSCGKPVVATDIPQSGVPWVNANGVSGINVEPENAEALADAIRAVVDDSEAYAVFSENAARRYEEIFTKNDMIKRCLNFYCEL